MLYKHFQFQRLAGAWEPEGTEAWQCLVSGFQTMVEELETVCELPGVLDQKYVHLCCLCKDIY